MSSIPGYETEITYPNIYPRSPEYQSALRDRHSHIVKQKGILTELRTFLDYCRNNKKVTEFHLLLKSTTKKMTPLSLDEQQVPIGQCCGWSQ